VGEVIQWYESWEGDHSTTLAMWVTKFKLEFMIIIEVAIVFAQFLILLSFRA
jgi:hypothetical protein